MSLWSTLLLAVPPALPLCMTAFNLVTWSRGRARERSRERVSVLIPARNEERNIAACVRAVAASRHPIHEIIVCDDQSTDRTREIVERLRGEIENLRVIAGVPMPPGWVGKPHACHRLARHASGEVLVFVDADTRLTHEGLERIISCFHDEAASVVTAVPEQVMGSWGERMLLPLLLLTYTSWFPLLLVPRSRDPRFVAANGQLLAVRRDAYDRIGGFEAVGHEIVDDVAFCRHAKRSGERVVFADGIHMASCRMYGSLSELWAGFSKNIYEGIGGTPVALAITVALYGGVFVAPYVALIVGLLGVPSLVLPALLGVVANVLTRSLLVLSHGHPSSGILTHPFAVVALLALAVSSYRRSRRGALEWAGRTYAARDLRLGAGS